MNNQQPLQLKIDGMTCGGCVRRVTAALTGLEGVTVEGVEVGKARVTLDEGLAVDDVVTVINRLGFTAHAPPTAP